MALTGKTAVITGSAQGIGFAIAETMASQGAAVGIFDINEKKAEETAQSLKDKGYQAISGYVDVSKVDSLKAMIEKTVQAFGYLDILVNNAGVQKSTPIPEVTEAEWDMVMGINLKSVFFASQQALPYLKERKQPRIINISSLAGRMGGYETGMSYTASKGGVISLTYGLARQFAPYGITVNAVCPGTTRTPIIDQWSDEQIAGLVARIPLGKLGEPRNIGSAVAYLASDEAEFITGLLMDVNGGMYFG
ncbi:MAG: 3-oxoacyl-ACP reductase FabG [Lachnospiraceae bacterium]|nr:3-oxoacyl-ACP reductase FabG [Lachnospiraceae bacterium]